MNPRHTHSSTDISAVLGNHDHDSILGIAFRTMVVSPNNGVVGVGMMF